MFTAEERDRVRSAIVDAARRDERITGIALTGSASADREDAWSDIDLAFGVRDAAALPAVLADLTALMHAMHGAVDHWDLPAGAWLYRVFLLGNTLQVDLGFAPAAEFGARAPTFRLLHGTARELAPIPPPEPHALVGLAWLYALHARSCIARAQLWRAELMVSGIRDQVFALACVRHGLPATQGRGMDQLPIELRRRIEDALVRRLDADELRRAFASAVDALLDETAQADAALASRIGDTVRALARP